MRSASIHRLAAGTLAALLLATAAFAAASDGDDMRAQLFRQVQEAAEEDEPEPELQGETLCSGGSAGAYPCNKVDLYAFLSNSSLGGGSGADIWGWTDPLTGREYALHTRSNGTSFVDITDPASPVHIGNLNTHSGSVIWRDVKVYRDHAFIVSESNGHGMQVFDLTQLRDVSNPPVTFSETAHYNGFGSAHNVAINEETGYAYALGTTDCNQGAHIVDIRKPTAPKFAGCIDDDGYTHDAQCVVYRGIHTKWIGKEICFNYNEDTLSIFSVIDKSQTELISRTPYFGDGYTHQGWLTEDHRYLFLGDELDEDDFGHNTRTRIFYLERLDAPFLVGAWDGPVAATDHNMYVKGNLLYQANYRAGLRILEFPDIANGNLNEIAYFDTYPASNSNSLSSAWSVYPFFDSETVVISTFGEGLFVVRPRVPEDFLLDADAEVLEVCDPGQDSATLSLTARNGYSASVTFSVPGLPAGINAAFDDNPVVAGAGTELTVTAAGATPGQYPFEIEATDGTLTRTVAARLDVANQLPPAPGGLSPSTGATDVVRNPKLSWAAATQAIGYTVEVATDGTFADIVYSAVVEETEHVVPLQLAADTGYAWRVTASNPCGSGAASATQTFDTTPVPSILLVDDDDDSPDVRAAYADALDNSGRLYDVWESGEAGVEPSADDLAAYDAVIWFSGDDFGGNAGPSAVAETSLGEWLDRSGCLLLASQDYFFDRGLTSFMQNDLGVSGVGDDVEQTEVTGLGSVFGGLGPFALDFVFPYPNFTDGLQPSGGQVALAGDGGNAGVQQGDDVQRTSYWGFGIEALELPQDREALLSAFLGWCDPLPGLDPDGDGFINADDCAPGDGNSFGVPGAATDLGVEPGTLSWTAPVVQGGSVIYDLLRSGSPDGFDVASCLESGDADTVAADGAVPSSGQVFYYLIRARNGCGGSLGADSDGTPRQGAVCN